MPDLPHGLLHGHEVGLTRGPRRRAHADEDDVGVRRDIRCVVREPEPAAPHVLLDERVQAGLVERQDAALQPRDLLLVRVGPHDLVTERGERPARHEAHMTGADHDDPHGSSISFSSVEQLVRRSARPRPACGSGQAHRAAVPRPHRNRGFRTAYRFQSLRGSRISRWSHSNPARRTKG